VDALEKYEIKNGLKTRYFKNLKYRYFSAKKNPKYDPKCMIKSEL